MVIREERADRFSARSRPLLILATLVPLALGSLCEGEGANSPGTIRQGPVDPRCSVIGGSYPSGFDLLPGNGGLAVAMQFSNPTGLLTFDVATSPPTPNNTGAVPVLPEDSDGDGFFDDLAYRLAGLCPTTNTDCRTTPKVGAVDAAFADLVFVTASGYEEVLFLAPGSGDLVFLEITNPGDVDQHRAADHPLYPTPGAPARRTALSTLTCVYPPTALDSSGGVITPSPHCDPGRTGFLTRFTAATAVVGDLLFVATSNLFDSPRALFHPGTVLVHRLDLDVDGSPIGVRPETATPVLFTTAFNPTGLTPHRTAQGRDVVLVTQTGAIDGAGTMLTDSAIDVIDAATLRVVATIPLGRAGATFGELAIDPGGHLALIGAEADRILYAIDLAALDDRALYTPRPDPVTLDGRTPGFADARIFAATSPLALSRRPDGPPDGLCITRTNVAVNHDGSRAYATDWCDGSLTVVSIDLSRPLERPLSPGRFAIERRLDLFAPKLPANFGLPAAPSLPRTRPGVPGRDFDGPDLFFLINETEGQLCSVRVEP